MIAPDRPGYGTEPGPARGLAGNADYAAAIVADLARPAVVVGHSYGAAIALRLAELRADLVSGLVLLCPAGSPRSLNFVDRALAWPVVGESGAWLVMRGTALLRTRALAGLTSASGLSPLVSLPSVSAWRRGDSWRTFAVEQRALVAELPTLADGLGTVTTPVEIVAGRRDRVVPPAAVRELAAALPEARVTWVPDVGHLLPWEQPELVAAVVARVAGT